MVRHLPLIFFSVLVACSSTSKQQVLLLDYTDFGPQVIAHELLGMEWWQWQPHGNSRPTTYPIKVAVYRKISLEEVQSRYPINREKEQDVRYVNYQEALTYLDSHIQENVMTEVTATLKNDRSKLLYEFGTSVRAFFRDNCKIFRK